MARPSKLTDKQWAAAERRVPPLGAESIRSVAKELGISEGALRKRVNTQVKPINALANQLATAEAEFERLPVSAQVKVRTLADKLKGISDDLASAASHGAATASKLARVANVHAEMLSEVAGDVPSPDDLRGIAALTNLANQAGALGMGLIAATKGAEPPPPGNGQAKLLTDDELAAIIANGGA